MATAEVRAAWQRTVNRCFVQEDAKRAPKIPCCPSASSSSKQVDASLAYATDGQENHNAGFMPFNRNPSYSDLPPESRWWLQLQPNYGYQKALTNELFNTFEEEMDSFGAGVLKSTSKASEVNPQDEDDVEHVDGHLNSEHSLDTYCTNKKDPEVEMKELKILYSESVQEPLKPNNMRETYKLLEMDPIGSSVLKQTNDFCFDSDFPWVGGDKTEPWWRMTDRDELASFIAQRSLDLVENCDLPHPLNTHVKRDPYPYLGHFDDDRLLPSSKDLKAQTCGLSGPTVSRQGSLVLGSAHGKQWTSSMEQSQYGSDKGNG